MVIKFLFYIFNSVERLISSRYVFLHLTNPGRNNFICYYSGSKLLTFLRQSNKSEYSIMLIKVEISTFGVDNQQNMPVIILKECGGERTIPISVGSMEASAIAIKSLDIVSQRPITIDLARLIITDLGGILKKVIINDLKKNVFYAKLYIAVDGKMHIIDCRPSDAIALALRCNCNIFVDDIVFDKTETGHILTKSERLKKSISQLDTMEFGRYYLE